MYYIYIIKCSNGSLYTGITTDPKRRFSEHIQKSGKGAKFTRANPPISLEALWHCETRSDAQRLEAQIKKLKRQTKLEIIADLNHHFPPEPFIREKEIRDYFPEQ